MKRKRILFVCTGNTCRSPMAEYLLRNKIKANRIKWWDVLSCGLQACEGQKMNVNSLLALQELDMDGTNFSAKQVTQKLLDKCDYIICMTAEQKSYLEKFATNVLSMRDVCGFDIPDPYGGTLEIYRATRDAISYACNEIVEKIKNF